MTHWQPPWPKRAPSDRLARSGPVSHQKQKNERQAAQSTHRDETERLLNTHEAADFLRLSDRTLERMRVTGTGPVYRKLGPGLRARVVYRMADLCAWLDQGTHQSTAEYGR